MTGGWLRGAKRWGLGWAAIYVLFMPVAALVFLMGFSIADRSDIGRLVVAVAVMCAADLALLLRASKLPVYRPGPARVTLALAPILMAAVVLVLFGDRAVGREGGLTKQPWGFAWGAQLLIGCGWYAIWLVKDYAPADQLPVELDPERYLKTVHDEYQALVWPTVAVAVTGFLATLFQTAQAALSPSAAGSQNYFGVIQAAAVVVAGLGMSLPVIRVLGHMTESRRLYSGRLKHWSDDVGEAEVTGTHRTAPRRQRVGALPRLANTLADVLTLVAAWLRR